MKNCSNKDVGYPGFGFAYFPLGVAHKGDQRRNKRDRDRTRRALSNVLFTFSLTPPQTTEKSKILSKNNGKNATHSVNPTTIRSLRGRKSQTYLDGWSRTSSIEWTDFYSNSMFTYPPKLRNTSELQDFLENSTTIRPLRRPKPQTYTDR